MTVAREHEQTDVAADDNLGGAQPWRRWLVAFLATVVVLGVTVYAAVVLIDPFATGRFTPIKSIELASNNPRLLKAGLVRDPRFDAAIFGSSTGYPLNPKAISDASGWRVAQFAIPASLPPSQLRVARAYQRFHGDQASLQIYVLDHFWCRPGDPASGGWGAFPDWVYESSDADYLSRILFPEGIKTAAQRVGLWLGVVQPTARDDGFLFKDMAPIPRAQLLSRQRPRDVDAPGAGFPALDLLAQHIAALPANVRVAFVFAPPHISMIPIAGSPADARLQACKARARQIAAARSSSAWLDLMTENEITRDEKNYFDEVHYTPAASERFAAAIVAALKQNGLDRPRP
jgi:hypothetical protein